MFGFGGRGHQESAAILSAIDRVQAVIKFDLDGTVTEVNDNFLKALGYERSDVIGRHHRMFVDPDYAASPEYEAFWNRLRGGAFEAGQFRRIGKSGKDVWIEASYNPVLGHDGRPFKVIKFATDITRQKEIAADQAGQLSAIRKSQAVIEFDLQGNVLDANENFCQALGYGIDEIRGRHHSMFIRPEERDTPEYGRFWARLRTGEFQSAQYLRLGKGGRQIWIQATYNPIFDAAGRPYKVVKFATDITAQVELLERLRSIINDNFAEISRAIDESTARSTGAEAAADVTTDAVQHMAAAAEELASSVEAIAHSMAQSRAATDSAMERAEEAGTFTLRLNEAAVAMGGIVGLIQKIAGQINLLALNATIEAARAGEFGRGFAVVAQEVKNLANQAASATDQITAEIGGIQNISGNVVEALDAIRKAIEGMRMHVSSTASAAEEQSAVTREIAGNMDNAARSVADIAGNVRGISQSVHVVSEKVDGTREAARVLAR